MMPVGDQCGRFQLSAAADQYPTPQRVDGTGHRVDQQSAERRIQHPRILETVPGFAQDQHCCDDDHHPLQHGAEEFGLVVAIGMIAVGGLGGDADGDQRGDGGCHVHRAFQRIRQKRDRAGQLPSQRLQRQHDQADDDAADGDLYGCGHGASFSNPVARAF